MRDLVLPAIERQTPVAAWIVDDTGFAKKGVHSVGVARQYCGRLGKQDNCQIAVSLSVAHAHASLPIAYRLYLPEEWARDPIRRAKAKVPEDVVFQTKPEIALYQIAAARAAGVTPGVVLADAAYGGNGAFRAGITALGLTYAVGIQSHTTVWPPGLAPLPPKSWSGRGRPPSLLRRQADHAPISVKDLALSLPADSWTSCSWREGTNTPLSSRFCAVRVRAAGRDWNRTSPHPVGTGNSVVGTGSYAIGDPNVVNGNNSVALGDNNTINANNAVAIGNNNNVAQSNAIAIGDGVTTTRANQIALGNASNTYTLAGINSAASRAAQSGPTNFVTSDAAGNLATSTFDPSALSGLDGRVGNLESRVDALAQYDAATRLQAQRGIAAVAATPSVMTPSAAGKTTFLMKVSEFHGEVGAGLTVAHRLDTTIPIIVFGSYANGGGEENVVSGGAGFEF